MSANSPTDAARLEIEHLAPGADLIHAGKTQLALGFPEEVVKIWMRAGKQPTAWLVPDVRAHGGIAQWALEFPLYFALFIQGKFGKGEKVDVLVREADWPQVVEYLRLTLLGLTREEMTAVGVEPDVVEMLGREIDHLALKRPDGSIAAIEDFLTPHFFDAEGLAVLDDLRIKAHGDNTYSFFTADDRIEEYRLEVSDEQQAPYAEAIPPGGAPLVPQPFELVTLGATNGFDPAGPCCNLLVQSNGRFLLVDAGPYIRDVLRHSGVSLDQIGAVVITHAHEDHAVGLSALLDLTRRLTLYLSRENAEIMRRKLAILNPHVASPETLLDDAFDVVRIDAGTVYDHYGLELRFHYTMHSIPCTGVELAMRDGRGSRRALIVGDHNARANVLQAAEADVLSNERLAELEALHHFDGDLVIADAGGGLIHGAPQDFDDSPAAEVVYVHTGKLPDEVAHRYSLAMAGHRYTVIAESGRASPLERGMARKALGDTYGAADPEWLEALLDVAQPLSVNHGHAVVTQGALTRDVYVALTGELDVLVERDGVARPVARLQAGELFGEMAVIRDAVRSATVRAATPARLLRIPGATFRTFAERQGLLTTLPEVWQNRSDLECTEILSQASVTLRNALARTAVRRTIDAGATLIREGSRSNTVFVLVRGRVQVYKGTDPLLVGGAPVIVDPGTLIGETAPFLKKARNASIVALDECEVLAIRGREFEGIVRGSPQLFRSISAVVRQRQAA